MLSNKYFFLFIIFIIFLFFCSKHYTTIEHMKDQSNNNIIVTKDDAINHLSNIMTLKTATELYDDLFINTNNLIVKLKDNHIIFTINNDRVYDLISDILFDRGIYQKFPWNIKNKLTKQNISVLTKQRLQDIYYLTNYIDVISTTPVEELRNEYIYYDIMEIIRYNKFNNIKKFDKPIITINMLLNRHPILNSYKNNIIGLISSKYPSFDINGLINLSKKEFIKNVHITRPYILENLQFKQYDLTYKNFIADSIYNMLFTIYDDNISFNTLLNHPSFIIYRNDILKIFVKSLNKLRIFMQPDYNYDDDINFNKLLNSLLLDINNLLYDIENIRDDIYLKQNKLLDDDMRNIIKQLINGQFNGTINDVFINNDHIDDIIAAIRTNIKRRHNNFPYDLIVNKINKQTKIIDLYNYLLFGLY